LLDGAKHARERLRDLDPATRQAALRSLLDGEPRDESASRPPRDVVNMHCHTFFSYNGYGHSPSSLAWLAHEEGWRALGTVDFDVLDAVPETLLACDRVSVRAAAGLETRTYVPEYADWEINSPGEPGVCYHVGIGFVGQQPPPAAAEVLRGMRQGAERRNRRMVARINAHLGSVAVNYDRDVIPMTPSGNATERHILVAYDALARWIYPERARLVSFWAGRLGVPGETVDAALGTEPEPNDLIRARLMKRGGVGYEQPDAGTFPPVDDVIRAIVACGAVPVWAWLDGASEGEQHLQEMLAAMIAKGVAALNIVPERNWHFDDEAVRATKVRELEAVISLAHDLDLPILVGTEMNKAGQPLLDDFAAEPLRPHVGEFLRGADWAYGHTLMQRALSRGYQSQWASRWLPRRSERNAFYADMGEAAQPGPDSVARLGAMSREQSPERLLAGMT